MQNEELHDKTVGEVHKLPCRACDFKTNHITLKSIQANWSDIKEDLQGWDKFEIIKCQGCDNLSFRSTSSFSEDYFIDNETGEQTYIEREQIYPNRIEGRKKLRDMYLLPIEINQIYEEAHTALCSKLNILSSVGIRIIIESICKEKNAEGKTLEKRIDDLSSKGILTKQEANTLHSTRILGNKSAHEIFTPKIAELDVAMDIVENLLKTVYIIPKKAERLGRE